MPSAYILILAILATTFTLAICAGDAIYPTSPVSSTVWKSGSSQTITWTTPLSETDPKAYDTTVLSLGTGSGNVVNKIKTIGSYPWPATKSATYTVPTGLRTGKIYCIQFDTTGTAGTTNSWSTWFTISDDGSVSTSSSSNGGSSSGKTTGTDDNGTDDHSSDSGSSSTNGTSTNSTTAAGKLGKTNSTNINVANGAGQNTVQIAGFMSLLSIMYALL